MILYNYRKWSLREKILEIGSCCASVPQAFADALHTENVIFSSHPYYTKAQKTINLESPFCTTPWIDFESRLRGIAEFREVMDPYPILHFHFHTLIPFFLDVQPMNYYRDHTVAMHFHGDDIRNRYWEKRATWKFDHIFYSTPDLKAHCPPEAIWIPNPVQPLENVGVKNHDGPVKVLHVATDPTTKRSNKGTPFIQNIMAHLIGKGTNLEFEIATGLPHAEVLKKIRGCDILIDQVSPYGIYGVAAVEAMYAGKPVLSTLNREWYPNCPVVPVRRDGLDLGEIVMRLVDQFNLRWIHGREGAEYALRVHDPGAVADRLMRCLE